MTSPATVQYERRPWDMMEIAIRAGPSLDGYWVLLLNDHYAVARI